MATTNLSSGISVSIANTPQATNDTFASSSTGLTEDNLQCVILDVMSNDLGGNAKILYSIDDGTNSLSDLLKQDTIRAEATSSDYSAGGAHIWITSDGKIG
jgi:hypothetical protein